MLLKCTYNTAAWTVHLKWASVILWPILTSFASCLGYKIDLRIFAHCHNKVTGMLTKWLERILFCNHSLLKIGRNQCNFFLLFQKFPKFLEWNQIFKKLPLPAKKNYIKKNSLQNSEINPPWHASGKKP